MKRNDTPLDEIEQKAYSGIVLSPGPENPLSAGNMMDLIEKYHDRLPMLGICLGHQALGMFFGAKLKKAIRPMHGKLSRIHISGGELFDKIPAEIEVVRYHSLVLGALPDGLLALAQTEENELMAFQHRHLPLMGVQFHPEAILTQYGMDMLKNWVTFNNIA